MCEVSDPHELKEQVDQLIDTLQALVDTDPEQEIKGWAIPVLAATLDKVRHALPNDPVMAAVIDPIMAEAMDERIRAVDMLLAARLVRQAIPTPLAPAPARSLTVDRHPVLDGSHSPIAMRVGGVTAAGGVAGIPPGSISVQPWLVVGLLIGALLLGMIITRRVNAPTFIDLAIA